MFFRRELPEPHHGELERSVDGRGKLRPQLADRRIQGLQLPRLGVHVSIDVDLATSLITALQADSSESLSRMSVAVFGMISVRATLETLSSYFSMNGYTSAGRRFQSPLPGPGQCCRSAACIIGTPALRNRDVRPPMALPLAVCEGRDLFGPPRLRWVSAVELGEQLRKLPTSGMVVESPDEVVARDRPAMSEPRRVSASFCPSGSAATNEKANGNKTAAEQCKDSSKDR